jgi:hypothetical protein
VYNAAMAAAFAAGRVRKKQYSASKNNLTGSMQICAASAEYA